MTSEGRKRKRSALPDAVLSPTQLSLLQPEYPEQPEGVEQPDYTDVDRVATAQDYIDVDLSSTPLAISFVHTPSEPTRTLTDEPTLPLTEDPYSQRSALSPAQLSPTQSERVVQPAYTDVDRAATAQTEIDVDLPTTPRDYIDVNLPAPRQAYKDVDQPTIASTVTSVPTSARSTLSLIDEPTHPLTEERNPVSPPRLSPTQLEYTDVDLPATPPVISPPHTPVRSTVPLTHANLRTIDPTMPQSNEGSTSSTKSVRVTRDQLRTWGHIIEDSNARTAHADFLAKASELVNSGRRSEMKPKSVEKAKKTYDAYKEFNEPTFLDAFWPRLVKDEYTPNDKDRPTVVTAEWLDDHVIGSKDQLFDSNCVVASTATTELQKAVRKDAGSLPLPKPDILYGLRSKEWCTEDQLAIIKRYERHTSVSPGLLLPWFIVEAKGLDGKIEEGVNQAARAGAVLNASWRCLDELAGTQPTLNGPDERSRVFSLVLNPTAALMNLHWAEVKDGAVVKFHTHHLHSYQLYKSDVWVVLRRDVDNVLEWGALGRKKIVSDLLDKLVEGGEAAHQKAKRMREGEEVRGTKRQKKSEGAGEGSV